MSDEGVISDQELTSSTVTLPEKCDHTATTMPSTTTQPPESATQSAPTGQNPPSSSERSESPPSLPKRDEIATQTPRSSILTTGTTRKSPTPPMEQAAAKLSPRARVEMDSVIFARLRKQGLLSPGLFQHMASYLTDQQALLSHQSVPQDELIELQRAATTPLVVPPLRTTSSQARQRLTTVMEGKVSDTENETKRQWLVEFPEAGAKPLTSALAKRTTKPKKEVKFKLLEDEISRPIVLQPTRYRTTFADVTRRPVTPPPISSSTINISAATSGTMTQAASKDAARAYTPSIIENLPDWAILFQAINYITEHGAHDHLFGTKVSYTPKGEQEVRLL